MICCPRPPWPTSAQQQRQPGSALQTSYGRATCCAARCCPLWQKVASCLQHQGSCSSRRSSQTSAKVRWSMLQPCTPAAAPAAQGTTIRRAANPACRTQGSGHQTTQILSSPPAHAAAPANQSPVQQVKQQLQSADLSLRVRMTGPGRSRCPSRSRRRRCRTPQHMRCSACQHQRSQLLRRVLRQLQPGRQQMLYMRRG